MGWLLISGIIAHDLMILAHKWSAGLVEEAAGCASRSGRLTPRPEANRALRIFSIVAAANEGLDGARHRHLLFDDQPQFDAKPSGTIVLTTTEPLAIGLSHRNSIIVYLTDSADRV